MELMTQMLVPCVLAGTALYGSLRRVDVYGALVRGAGQGLETLARILPALVCLLTAVSMVRASGLLEALASWLSPVLGRLGLPSELLPLMLVRPISGSAALGVGADLINAYGPDSALGRTAAVMLGSTETTFYTIAVYFSAAGITRTRYAVPAGWCLGEAYSSGPSVSSDSSGLGAMGRMTWVMNLLGSLCWGGPSR